ncbi:hypothetical protein, partial [Aeromonas caviae]|uniref:hypothetical protein n=1 Tax=Aeromonas caviae TaxID=648 RepID=UPI001FC84C51
MGKIIVQIPSIKDNDYGYHYLIKLSEYIIKNPNNFFYLDFKQCSIIEQNAITIIGGLCNYINSNHSRTPKSILNISSYLIPERGIGFQVDTISKPVLDTLIETGFMYYIEKNSSIPINNGHIGYFEHDIIPDDNELTDYLSNVWLSEEKLNIDSNLKNLIISKLVEIFTNAYGHGLNKNPFDLKVISCGQYRTKSKQLALSVLDLGGGIIERVTSVSQPELKPSEAMKWALLKGNSTRTDSSSDLPRGLGFDILKEFVYINCGEIRIYSNNCLAKLNPSDSKYHVQGESVNILLNFTQFFETRIEYRFQIFTAHSCDFLLPS